MSQALNAIPEMELNTDLTPEGLLSEGCFDTVRRGSWLGAPVALKCLNTEAAEVGEGPVRAFEKEMRVLAHLRHPNLMPVYGVCRHADGRLTLVEELQTGGTLYRRLNPVGGEGGAAPPVRMGLAELAKVGSDVARALHFVHSHGIVHNDVKSLNVLFNAAGAAVLTDFGLSTRARNAQPGAALYVYEATAGNGLVGTISHCAPENYDDGSDGYGQPPADIYSFGMMLYEMATGGTPWAGENLMGIIKAVTTGRRPALPADIDARVAALVESCWAQDPAARPTAGAALEALRGLEAQ